MTGHKREVTDREAVDALEETMKMAVEKGRTRQMAVEILACFMQNYKDGYADGRGEFKRFLAKS